MTWKHFLLKFVRTLEFSASMHPASNSRTPQEWLNKSIKTGHPSRVIIHPSGVAIGIYDNSKFIFPWPTAQEDLRKVCSPIFPVFLSRVLPMKRSSRMPVVQASRGARASQTKGSCKEFVSSISHYKENLTLNLWVSVLISNIGVDGRTPKRQAHVLFCIDSTPLEPAMDTAVVTMVAHASRPAEDLAI